jgi:hypothetical protein
MRGNETRAIRQRRPREWACIGILLGLYLAPITADAALGSPIREIQPAQRHFFAVFGSRPEPLSPTLRTSLEPPLPGKAPQDMRLNLRLAQRVGPSPDEATIWAVPGDGRICIYVRWDTGAGGAGSTCGPTMKVVRRGISIYRFGGGIPGHTAGMVRNGVAEVRIKDTRDSATVTENGFFARGRVLL